MDFDVAQKAKELFYKQTLNIMDVKMLWFSLLLVTVLVFFSVSVACLPFLCERNRTLAITHKSILYDKSAQHLAMFGVLAFFVFGVALFLDYYFNGFIVQYFIRPKFLDIIFILLANLFLLGGIVFFVLRKAGNKFQKVLFKFNIFIGAMLLVLISLLSWLYLRSTTMFEEWSLVQLWTHEPLRILFLVYMSLCVFLGFMGAHILSIIFFIIRRNHDDYGRDYYNIIIASHAKRAVYSGLLLCIPVAILLFAMPISHEKLAALVLALFNLGLTEAPVNAESTLTTFSFKNISLFIYALILLIPLSVLCLQRVTKSQLPMQKKSLILFSFLFLILGLTVLMFRLWF